MVSYFHMWDLIKIVRKRRHCKLFSTKRRHISFVCEVFKVIKRLELCEDCNRFREVKGAVEGGVVTDLWELTVETFQIIFK